MMRPGVITAVLLAGLMASGCRGMESDRPPIHPNLNMDFQKKFDPQEVNPFFADRRAMRPPVPGTIARGMLREDAAFYYGRTASGAYVSAMPVPVTRELIERGQDRYQIFCAVCHGDAGDGKGIIMTGKSQITGSGFGYTPVPTYHDDRLRQVEEGYLYDVIANGVRNMPSYAQQIPVADRWAIVAYVRALQRSQNAPASDVPAGSVAGAPGDPASGAAASEAPPPPPETQNAAPDSAAAPSE